MQRVRIVGLIAVAVGGLVELLTDTSTALDIVALVAAIVGVACWTRSPLVSAALVAGGLVMSAVDDSASLVGLGAALFTLAVVAAASDRHTTAIATGVVVAAMVVTAMLDTNVSAAQASQPIALAVAVAVGVHAVRAAVQRREAHARLQSELDLVRARADLARDVHDVTSHALMAVLTQIRVARLGVDSNDRDVAGRGLDRAEGAAKNAVADLRGLTMMIAGRAMPLASCTTIGEVISQIRDACDDFPLSSFTSEVDDGPIDPRSATTAVRVAQQCLANAAAHSPNSPAMLAASVSSGSLLLTVSNRLGDGGEAGTQLGLTIMEHRVAEIGGSLSAGARDGAFVVRCAVPLGRAQ